jgi:hypothetical protein
MIRETTIANTIDAHYAKGMDNHAQRTMIKYEDSGKIK